MGRLVIVGVGLRGERHLTLETVEALRAADVVFHLITGVEAVRCLERYNPETHSLLHFYREGALDLDVYGDIASYLLAQSIERDVVFAVMGHPSIYVAATHLLVEHGPRWGVEVTVLAGISTLDALLLMMPHDIGNTGLQILDANRLVTYGLRPDPSVPLMLFQVGCFGSGYITRSQMNGAGRLAPLAAYLSTIYPATHLVHLIEYGMGYPHRSQMHRMTLADLAVAGALVTYNSTLFIPPAVAFQVVDPGFQAQLIDPRAVGNLVQL